MSTAARHYRWPSCLIVGLGVPLVLVQAASADVRLHVDGDQGLPNATGLSWATAKKYLTDALADAALNADENNSYEIWVAASPSPYRPDQNAQNPLGTDDPAASFDLVKFTRIYGGFHGNPGGEGQLTQRDYVANLTVLSGEIGLSQDNDNTTHIVTAFDVDNSAVLDGVTIVDGYAADSYGAGIMVFGTGDPSNPGPVIARCKLTENFADIEGGGAYFFGPGTHPTFVNSSFIANHAGAGGAMGWEGVTFLSGATLVNCLFAFNIADDYGGAIRAGAFAEIINCTFANNLAPLGQAIYTSVDGHTVTNSIFWGGPNQIFQFSNDLVTVNYSDVQGGWTGPGTNNINADPLFVNAAIGDYRLSKPCSPCVDAGHPDDGGTVNSSCTMLAGYSVPCAQTCPSAGSGILCDAWDVDQDASMAEPTPDLRYPSVANSAPRVLDGEGDAADDARIDMGAYEFVRECCPWDCQMNAPADGRVGTDDLNTLLTQWGQTCTTCDFGAGPDGVGNEDRQALLAHWGRCGCTGVGSESAAGPESELTLEDAIAIMGFDGVDAYLAWGQQATEAEVYASTVALVAILGSGF